MGGTVAVGVFLEVPLGASLGCRPLGWAVSQTGAGRGEGASEKEETYSTCLDQEGGLLMVMNTQLVRMVIMMNMLNSVRRRVKESEGAGGEGRWAEGLLAYSTWLCPPLTPSCPCTRPTWAGYEWMSTLMAQRLMMLKGLSM